MFLIVKKINQYIIDLKVFYQNGGNNLLKTTLHILGQLKFQKVLCNVFFSSKTFKKMLCFLVKYFLMNILSYIKGIFKKYIIQKNIRSIIKKIKDCCSPDSFECQFIFLYYYAKQAITYFIAFQLYVNVLSQFYSKIIFKNCIYLSIFIHPQNFLSFQPFFSLSLAKNYLVSSSL